MYFTLVSSLKFGDEDPLLLLLLLLGRDLEEPSGRGEGSGVPDALLVSEVVLESSSWWVEDEVVKEEERRRGERLSCSVWR